MGRGEQRNEGCREVLEPGRGVTGPFCLMERRSRIPEGEVFQEGEAGEAEGKGKGRPLVRPRNHLPRSRNVQGKLSAVSHGGAACVYIWVIGASVCVCVCVCVRERYGVA